MNECANCVGIDVEAIKAVVTIVVALGVGFILGFMAADSRGLGRPRRGD